MDNNLRKELENRGTAEIVDGQVLQVTQALNETEEKVEYLIFGKLQESKIILI
jgi:hypothetical protein